MSIQHKLTKWLCVLWLGSVLPCTASTARAQDEDFGEDETPARTDAGDAESESEASESEAKPEGSEKPASEAPTGPGVSVQPYAGIGMAMRSFSRPTSLGLQKLAASAVPGAEVGLTVVAWPEEPFSLGFNLAYQTALGFTVTESPPFALQNHVRARSERVALDIAPTWHFGALNVGVAIGASARVLWPEAHLLMTPGYSLIGPHARLELTARFNERLTVRIAPEGQWIVLIDQDLKATGVSSQGMAVGGEAAVNITVSDHIQVGVNYRESHALISTNRNTQFQDVERYLTLRGTGSF